MPNLFNSKTLRNLSFLSAIAGGTALAPILTATTETFATTFSGTMLFAGAATLVSMLGNIWTGEYAASRAARLASPKYAHPNNDLARLLGDAISRVLHNCATEHPAHKAWFTSLAKIVPNCHLAIANHPALESVRSDRLPLLFEQAARTDEHHTLDLLNETATLHNQPRTIAWQLVEFLRIESKQPESHAHPIAEQAIIRTLFAAIREMLKRNPTGRAYAALQLDTNGEILARLGDLAQNQSDMLHQQQITTIQLATIRRLLTEQANKIYHTAGLSEDERLALKVILDEVLDNAEHLSRIEGKIDALHTKIDTIDTKIDALGDKFGKLETSLDAYKVEASAILSRYLAANAELSRTIVDREAEIVRIASALREAQTASDNGDTAAEIALAEVRKTGDLRLLQETLGRITDEQFAKDQKKFEERQAKFVKGCHEVAFLAYLRGDIAEVESRLNKILSIFPNDFEATNFLGHVFGLRGDFSAAERQYRRLLKLGPQDELLRAVAFGGLGNIAQKRGELETAEKNYREAVAIYKKIGRLEGQAIQLTNLGLIAQTRGEFDVAEKLHWKALDIFRKVGTLDQQAITLNNLGLIARTLGNLNLAEIFHHAALTISLEFNMKELEASQLGNLGTIAHIRGNFAAAENHLRDALDIYRKLKSLEGQACTLGNLGLVAQTRGDIESAEKIFDEALKISDELGAPELQASILGNLGILSQIRSDFGTAEKRFHKSLEINRRLGRLEGQAIQLGNLGLNYLKCGKLDLAEKFQLEAMDIFHKLGALERQATVLSNLGLIAMQRGKFANARKLLTESRDLFARNSMPHMVQKMQSWIDAVPPE